MYAHIYAWFYRRWSLLIHRYGYHHMQVSYPADEFGVHPSAWCHWCGMRAKVPPTAEQNIAAIRRAKALRYGEQR